MYKLHLPGLYLLEKNGVAEQARTSDYLSHATEKRPFLRRVADRVFGYDYFISYRHYDGGKYALALTNELEKQGFECFLDRSKYRGGDDWKKVGYWTLRRTMNLIVVGTPGALTSSPVLREVRIFSGFRRRIVPIEFADSLDPTRHNSPLLEYLPESILRISEGQDQLKRGPSGSVIEKLRTDFEGVRQDTRNIRFLSLMVLVFAILAVVAGVFYALSERNAFNLKNTLARNFCKMLVI